ncbi:MAG: hypothetical protein HY867_06780 [Chloroflexi bacterium]|nr:hypothetical protein [Chloroflexota bacterium]
MKRILAIIFILLFAIIIVSPVAAQGDYYFAVESEVVNVYYNADGTMSLDYLLVFVNQPGAHVIDYVDMGMPNYNFSMSTVTAEVNGVPVSASESDYAGNGSGFAVVLGGQSIQPGQRGTVHVNVGKITDVLHPDDDDELYASAVFVPTYFGSQYVTGSTDLTMIFHLPPGISPEEPRWHAAPSGFPAEPEAGHDGEGRVFYKWRNPAASMSDRYTFGASFPRAFVPADAIYTPPPAPMFNFNFDDAIPFIFMCCFGFFFFGMPIMNAVNANRRKLKYLPPRIAIEGHGIKRGLTAVEAAILMEQPLDKVMTMILFGVVKKDAAEVTKRDPLELAFAKEQPAELHQYEKDFLKAFGEKDAAPRRKLLQDMTIALVRSVSDKMKGFSRKETADYYKSIMERAWTQVEAADTPEVKSQKFDENLEWTMLDKDYDDRTRRTMSGPVYMPRWWGHYDPRYSTSRPIVSSGGGKVGVPASGGGAKSLPGADFAASIVTGVQGFSSKVLGNVQSFTEKVTGTTNPPPKVTSSGSRGGGGGGRSCACACACAGCACACAGGGR